MSKQVGGVGAHSIIGNVQQEIMPSVLSDSGSKWMFCTLAFAST